MKLYFVQRVETMDFILERCKKGSFMTSGDTREHENVKIPRWGSPAALVRVLNIRVIKVSLNVILSVNTNFNKNVTSKFTRGVFRDEKDFCY